MQNEGIIYAFLFAYFGFFFRIGADRKVNFTIAVFNGDSIGATLAAGDDVGNFYHIVA